MYRSLTTLSFLVFFLVLGSYFGCSLPNEGICYKNSNCPEGQECVGRSCQPIVAKEKNKEKAKEEPVKDSATLPEPKPEPTNTKCSSSDDCKDPSKQHCYKQSGKCVSGFMNFTFSRGHFIIDFKAPRKRCQGDIQCASWQGCSNGYCSVTGSSVNQNATGSGKILGRGLALHGYSYSELTKTSDGKSAVNILMRSEVSDKLVQFLVIEIPFSSVKSGKVMIDGKTVKAYIYNDKVEFIPAIRETRAIAYGGYVKLDDANTKLGGRISGEASILFHAP